MKKYIEFINEHKVASDESPYGFYDICNSIPPDDLFKELEKLGIKYTHDAWRNFIKIYTDKGKMVRDLLLGDVVYDAVDIDKDELPYCINDPNDLLELVEI